MWYISKGLVVKGSTEQILNINRCGVDFKLTGPLADLWLAGRFCLAPSADYQCKNLHQLQRMGLAECSDEPGELGTYRMLTNCIIVPAKLWLLHRPLSSGEKVVWEWLSKAGIRLTIAELVYLIENQVSPASEYLGEGNRQSLVERIYTQDNVLDGILDTAMENAGQRDAVVKAICSLLRKKRILLI